MWLNRFFFLAIPDIKLQALHPTKYDNLGRNSELVMFPSSLDIEETHIWPQMKPIWTGHVRWQYDMTDDVFKKGTRAHKYGSDPETLKETLQHPVS